MIQKLLGDTFSLFIFLVTKAMQVKNRDHSSEEIADI